MVAEVGVKTHTATQKTHTLILPDLCGTKLPQRRWGKKNQDRHTRLLKECASSGVIFRAPLPLNEEGLDFFTWAELRGSAEAHADMPVPLYKVLEKGGSSQLILLLVVK